MKLFSVFQTSVLALSMLVGWCFADPLDHAFAAISKAAVKKSANSTTLFKVVSSGGFSKCSEITWPNAVAKYVLRTDASMAEGTCVGAGYSVATASQPVSVKPTPELFPCWCEAGCGCFSCVPHCSTVGGVTSSLRGAAGADEPESDVTYSSTIVTYAPTGSVADSWVANYCASCLTSSCFELCGLNSWGSWPWGS